MNKPPRNDFEFFTKEELNFFKQFRKPYDIQLFLNGIEYNPDTVTNSPSKVIERQSANCFEGALFAAAALEMLGHKPLIVDMAADNDDDHVIAVFKQNGSYGAVAKSNTTVLRFREPVYRTLRELVMSYFDFYFNTLGEKSLRSYSNPVDLSKFDKFNWMTSDEDLEYIGDYLYTIKHHKILNSKLIRALSPADNDLLNLCFSGSIQDGLFKPEKRKVKNQS
ncbi:MAG: hypothetical protein M1470_03065 [Bacteroidetes bacterium]|nr:hypothetical protein [Bacteroidota bacterium]MCL5737452.1 hypothetical protein [Bacteroidota bacterium]